MDCSKEVVYQVYPKSFQDTTGNGTGDLKGITSHLDYLKDLGITCIWLNPIYPSPQNDNGYDVSDYTAIDPAYGTMADLEELVAQAKKRGIRIMLDMVFNHTSTGHEWFKKALAGDPDYKDFYIWKKGSNGQPPTNWVSKFGGSAWKYVPEFDEYYLHLFDVSQADLNWKNPKVRDELVNVLKFWIGKGVGGFRFDVINLIDKKSFGSHEGTEGKEFYTDGPLVGSYLHELYERALKEGDVMTVGEMGATTIESCAEYSNPDNEELSMCFSFHHLKVDYENKQKWSLAPFDFLELKNLLNSWDVEIEKRNGWNALFWNCHDQPRSISRFGDPVNYPEESGKMLAAVNFTRRGTPYIHYGEEIGMKNLETKCAADYADIESHNAAKTMAAQGKSDEEILATLQAKSRDNGRIPMQWNASRNGDFTSGTPWLMANNDLDQVNVEAQLQDPNSIYSYYKQLIELKKTNPILRQGSTIPILEEDPMIYGYKRTLGDQEILCLHNFYSQNATHSLELENYSRILSNYPDWDGQAKELRPYESLILQKKA